MNNYTMMSNVGNNKSARFICGLVVLLLISISLLTIPACSPAENANPVVLEILPDPVLSSTLSTGIPFDEKNSWILRCVSITEIGNGITASVTKSKSAGIKSLIFINLADNPDSSSSTLKIASVNLQGAEGDYDISGAVFHTVKLTSALDAAKKYGIPYEDWLIGTMSQDELFPCCK